MRDGSCGRGGFVVVIRWRTKDVSDFGQQHIVRLLANGLRIAKMRLRQKLRQVAQGLGKTPQQRQQHRQPLGGAARRFGMAAAVGQGVGKCSQAPRQAGLECLGPGLRQPAPDLHRLFGRAK